MSWERPLSPPRRRLLTVSANDALGAYRVLRVADPEGPPPAPGQFAMLAAAERWGGGLEERPFLPRAFSYARHENGEAHFLLEDVGPGTKRLCELAPGDGLHVLGPLGQGFSAPGLPGADGAEDAGGVPSADGASGAGGRAILVGGGVGIAPLAILQDRLGPAATVLLGFRDATRVPGGELLRDARIASDDGSAGHHGLVTEMLEGELERDGQATVYACGPAPMLEGVRAICERAGVPAQLALESGMACGFGACFGCVVPTREGGYVRVCVDGPVIAAERLERVDAHAGAPA